MEKMNSLNPQSVEFPSTMVASILQGMISYTDHFISPPLLAESSKRYGEFFNASRPRISLPTKRGPVPAVPMSPDAGAHCCTRRC